MPNRVSREFFRQQSFKFTHEVLTAQTFRLQARRNSVVCVMIHRLL